MGGVTYRDMAAVWPGSDSDYAAPMGELHVEIARLKDEPGNDLLAHRRRHVRASAHTVWPAPRSRKRSRGLAWSTNTA
jgi:hypothetical protein